MGINFNETKIKLLASKEVVNRAKAQYSIDMQYKMIVDWAEEINRIVEEGANNANLSVENLPRIDELNCRIYEVMSEEPMNYFIRTFSTHSLLAIRSIALYLVLKSIGVNPNRVLNPEVGLVIRSKTRFMGNEEKVRMQLLEDQELIRSYTDWSKGVTGTINIIDSMQIDLMLV